MYTRRKNRHERDEGRILYIGAGTYGPGKAMPLPLKILPRPGPTNNYEGPTSRNYYPDLNLIVRLF